MAVVIDGVDMPRICQECPCFDVITARQENSTQELLVQFCKAKQKTMRPIPIPENINQAPPSEWMKTKRPSWCPMTEVRMWVAK